MAYAYVMLTTERILDFLPIKLVEYKKTKKEPKRAGKKLPKVVEKENPEEPKESRICFMCKDEKPNREFGQHSYCKSCRNIYQKWHAYDKKREKIEGEDKKQIKEEFIKKLRSEYKQ